MVSEFDAERDQKPTLDVYAKAAAAAAGGPMTLYIDKIVMHQTPQVATWFVCFEAKTEDAQDAHGPVPGPGRPSAQAGSSMHDS